MKMGLGRGRGCRAVDFAVGPEGLATQMFIRHPFPFY